jgi:hypothetical protein
MSNKTNVHAHQSKGTHVVRLMQIEQAGHFSTMRTLAQRLTEKTMVHCRWEQGHCELHMQDIEFMNSCTIWPEETWTKIAPTTILKWIHFDVGGHVGAILSILETWLHQLIDLISRNPHYQVGVHPSPHSNESTRYFQRMLQLSLLACHGFHFMSVSTKTSGIALPKLLTSFPVTIGWVSALVDI